ncbi:MAG: (4Fe-4S)-binding protein [Planctomycetales bacterium 4572_13]|nr:MAG: (4Fe-4S)-binding protein [Planctomycetales bacterium 4572_13]
MKIAIASGKGGTGKTTIATNLACSIAQMGSTAQYLDCDVEEPNGHIFLKPEIDQSQPVTIAVPQVDEEKCNGCGQCGKLCQYSAIICLKDKAMTFDQLCHSCGGCMLVCPTGAITEKPKEIGFVESGMAKGVHFGQGRLRIGDIHTPPLIKQVKARALAEGVVIVDAPPGTSCPVIEAVKGSDFILLVTEPTPFGLNDLKLAVGMVSELKIPFAVVVNRSEPDEQMTRQYCQDENIEIILEVPDDRRIAEAYSVGEMIVDILPEYKDIFTGLYETIAKKIKG